jgi:hypothetical protein
VYKCNHLSELRSYAYDSIHAEGTKLSHTCPLRKVTCQCVSKTKFLFCCSRFPEIISKAAECKRPSTLLDDVSEDGSVVVVVVVVVVEVVIAESWREPC